MQYLILTIVLSSLIYLIFKWFTVFKIATFQAIVVNYGVCAIMGFIFASNNDPNWISSIPATSLPYALFLGALFITLFNFIAQTTHEFGVGVASLSDKLSLVIPVLIAFFAYKDGVTVLKIVGILAAIIAVWLSVSSKKGSQTTTSSKMWLPIAVFIGGGIISSLLKEVEFKFPGMEFNQFLVFLFGTAFLLGLFVFMFKWISGKVKPSPKSWLAGILLGIPNYGSIYFLMKTLDIDGWESSMVFPVNNIGIVLLTAIAGFIIFKENLTKRKLAGLGLSMAAIFLLLFEQLNG